MKSIIVVTFNSEKYIQNCLNSIKLNISKNDELFIIDNYSTDHTLEIIKKNNLNNLKLICNQKNLGFSKAVNQALVQTRGEYTFLINPDTNFKTSVFDDLISLANQKKKIGIAGPGQKSSKFWFAACWGNFPNKYSKIIRALKLNRLLPIGDWVPYNFFNHRLFVTNRQVDWVSGGFMLIKKQVIQKIGYFDENFFMYYEDVDYCKRAKQAGFEIWYFGRIQVNHLTGASSGQKKNKINKLSQTSLNYYLKKHKS